MSRGCWKAARAGLLLACVLVTMAAMQGGEESDLAGRTTPDLTGTSWKLVKIAYSDDTTHVPDDPEKYTLMFEGGGRVIARIDCNRGRGSWKSDELGRIEFGPMALTRAICPEGSLHDLVVRDLPSFRSYLVERGHLFMAMFADGGIYEWAPLEAAPESP